MKLARFAAIALVIAGLGAGARVARADGKSKELPPSLREAGFTDDLDAALAQARAEHKLVFVYVLPAWFSSGPCEMLERGALSTEEFKARAKEFLPVRVAAERGSPLLRRLQAHEFPALRFLNADGFIVLAEPREKEHQWRTASAIATAHEQATKADAEFAEALAKADMKNPETRALWIQKLLDRGDAGSASRTYDGFDEKDASPARLRALEPAIVAFLIEDRVEDAEKRLDAAAKLWPQAEQPRRLRLRVYNHRLSVLLTADKLAEADALVALAEKTFAGDKLAKEAHDLGARILVHRIDKAVAAKEKAVAFKNLEELVQKFPDHDFAKKKDHVRKSIEAQIEGTASRPTGPPK